MVVDWWCYCTVAVVCIIGWEWHDWDCLPNNLFLPLLKLKENGYDPFSNKSDGSLSCIDMKCS